MSNGRKFRRNIESESLFEHEMSVSELMKLGNPLEYLDKIVDFEVFRPTLEDVLVNNNRKNNAGHRPLDPVFIFKVLVLQRLYGLSDEQKASNREKSEVRSRVEHVFGFVEGSMGGMVFRTVGMVRAKACVALTNLTYNIARFMQISKYHPQWICVPC